MPENEGPDGSDARPEGAGDNLPVRDWWGEPDRALSFLVSFVNELEFSLSIRVFIDGGVVSGDLISGSRYFELLADELLGESDGDDGEDPISSALASFYRDASEQLRALARGSEDADDASGLPLGDIRHLHVRDATLHAPGSEPLTVGLWRGRLAQVSGWSLGRYGA